MGISNAGSTSGIERRWDRLDLIPPPGINILVGVRCINWIIFPVVLYVLRKKAEFSCTQLSLPTHAPTESDTPNINLADLFLFLHMSRSSYPSSSQPKPTLKRDPNQAHHTYIISNANLI